jgi:hypothetical protein
MLLSHNLPEEKKFSILCPVQLYRDRDSKRLLFLKRHNGVSLDAESNSLSITLHKLTVSQEAKIARHFGKL